MRRHTEETFVELAKLSWSKLGTKSYLKSQGAILRGCEDDIKMISCWNLDAVLNWQYLDSNY